MSTRAVAEYLDQLQQDKKVERVRINPHGTKVYQLTERGKNLHGMIKDYQSLKSEQLQRKFTLEPEIWLGTGPVTASVYTTPKLAHLFKSEEDQHGEEHVPVKEIVGSLMQEGLPSVAVKHIASLFYETETAPEDNHKLSVDDIANFDFSFLITVRGLRDEPPEIQRRRVLAFLMSLEIQKESRTYSPWLTPKVFKAMRRGGLLTKQDYRSIRGKSVKEAARILWERYRRAFFIFNCPQCNSPLQVVEVQNPQEWICPSCRAEAVQNPKLRYKFNLKQVEMPPRVISW